MSQSDRTHKVPTPALTLLALMMSVGPFGDTEYTPAMPDIAQALDVNYGMVQLTMTAYLLGTALSQIFYGPISDRFGRRPVMLAGTWILLAGATLCLASFWIWPLIAGRFVQGVGACAGAVIADAAVRDAFPADCRQQIYARLNAAFALAPALGPVIGYFAVTVFGWHGNFAVLVALAAVLLVLVWRYLPETNLELKREALEPVRVVRDYWRVFLTDGFAFYAVLGGCCVGLVYTALIGAPDLVINVLKSGESGIIIVAGAILVAFVAGAGLCTVLTDRIANAWIILAGLLVMLAASAALMGVGIFIGDRGNLVQYLLPIALAFVGVGLVVPVTTALAMAPFGESTGTAASLLGVVRMGTAALGTLAMSLLHRGSVIDMPIVFLSLSALSLLVFGGEAWRRGLAAMKGETPG